MTVSFPQPDGPALSGRRLSRLLARWAGARRLDPGRIEAIKAAARTAPVDLGFAWWWRLLDPENGSVFRATAKQPAFAETSGPPVEPPFSIGRPGLVAWPPDGGPYQPYLRLT
jgi:hypothetical protein